MKIVKYINFATKSIINESERLIEDSVKIGDTFDFNGLNYIVVGVGMDNESIEILHIENSKKPAKDNIWKVIITNGGNGYLDHLYEFNIDKIKILPKKGEIIIIEGDYNLEIKEVIHNLDEKIIYLIVQE